MGARALNGLTLVWLGERAYRAPAAASSARGPGGRPTGRFRGGPRASARGGVEGTAPRKRHARQGSRSGESDLRSDAVPFDEGDTVPTYDQQAFVQVTRR